MSKSEWLVLRGWRRIGHKPNLYNKNQQTVYWDHPNHQPFRGAFTTTDAYLHQKRVDRRGCDCINQQQQ